METDKSLAAWMKDHLWQIGAACLALYGGYVTGQMTMQAKIDALALRITDSEKREATRISGMQVKLAGRFAYMNDATSRINFLCQDDAECRSKFSPLRVPE